MRFRSLFFDNLVMKEGKRRRRWPCDPRRELRVLRSYAGTLIFQTRKPIGLFGIYVLDDLIELLLILQLARSDAG